MTPVCAIYIYIDEGAVLKVSDPDVLKRSLAPRLKAMSSILTECKRLTTTADETIAQVSCSFF